jgi:cyclic nucleotide gated channel
LDIEKQSGGQGNPEGAFIVKWHAIFLVMCGIAVLYVDPLFLYLPVINQDHKCLTLDRGLMIIAICFRLVFDMIYAGNIIFGYFSRRNGRTGLAPYDRQPRQIIKRYLRTYFPIDILAILPLPQVRETFMLLNCFFVNFLFLIFQVL